MLKELGSFNTELTLLPGLYQNVKDSNPLNADELLSQIPEFNNPKGAVALIERFKPVLQKFAESPKKMQFADGIGLTRDLSLVASLITKYGHQLSAIPGLEETMLFAADFTKESPVWTVWHYANGNPKEKGRSRKFSYSWEEELFRDCLEQANLGWITASFYLSKAREIPVIDSEFVSAVNNANVGLEQARVAMGRYVTVDTEFFNSEIASNFRPITVNGKTYRNASGAGLGILIVEEELVGRRDAPYFGRHIDELPKPLQDAVRIEKMPILKKVLSELEILDDVYKAYPGLRAVHDSVKLIHLFDKYHLARAKKAMGEGGRSEGSGGEPKEKLEELGSQRLTDYMRIKEKLFELEKSHI